jgi:hypothetical protein
MRLTIGRDSALIIVDAQKDFCYGGALPVPQGDKVIPVLNRYIKNPKKLVPQSMLPETGILLITFPSRLKGVIRTLIRIKLQTVTRD